jgi:CBS domain-containing protein
MAPNPVYGVNDQTVDAFVTGTAAQHPHDTYPVVDPDGRLVGMVRLEDLARIPESGRSGVPLHSATAPISSVPTIAPEDPAADAIRNLSPANPLLPVADHERLVGVVAASDVANAIQLSRLNPPP